jgi:hypothetical protein
MLHLHSERAAQIPHHSQAIQLNIGLARRLIDAHRAWIDDAEAT